MFLEHFLFYLIFTATGRGEFQDYEKMKYAIVTLLFLDIASERTDFLLHIRRSFVHIYGGVLYVKTAISCLKFKKYHFVRVLRECKSLLSIRVH